MGTVEVSHREDYDGTKVGKTLIPQKNGFFMPRPHEVRTFVQLEFRALEFLRVLQRLTQKKFGLKKAPHLHRVIQGALLDYQHLVETGANPDLLRAFAEVTTRHRTKKRAGVKEEAKRPLLSRK